MYCRNCGKEIDDNAAVCIHCGVSTKDPKAEQPVINVVNNNTNTNKNIGGFQYRAKNRWVAFFLCLFLGYLGFHRFYVGKVGTGIIYLFTFGFFGIGWILDLILILIGGFRDKAGFPLS